MGPCTPVFTAALFAEAKTWKRPDCPQRHECIHKTWCTHTVGCRSAVSGSGVLTRAVTGRAAGGGGKEARRKRHILCGFIARKRPEQANP